MNKTEVQIKELTDELLPPFERYLKRDRLINALILRDIYHPYLRKRCQFYLAMNNEDIVAMLLIYRPPIPGEPSSIWLLGNEVSAFKLSNLIHEDKATIHTTLENFGVIEKKFSRAAKYTVDSMVIRKGEEKLESNYRVERINPGEYLEERVILAGKKPDTETIELWRMLDKEKVDFHTYLGFADDKVVSISSVSHVVENIWLIGWTYTKPEFRRRGYATCMLSKAVKDIFDEFGGQYATLFVLGHNEPAKTLYRKIGFSKVGEMIWWEHNTDIFARTVR